MAIRYLPVDGRFGNSPGNAKSGPAIKNWAGTTVYAVGDYVENGGFVFKCATAGTSGASIGPTPQYLTDGTAVWTFVASSTAFTGSEPVQNCELGYIGYGKDTGSGDYGLGEFMYVKFTGATAIVAGDFVTVDRFGKTCTQLPAGAPGASKFTQVGIAMGSHALNVATPTYGWVMLRGIHDAAKALAGAATTGTTLSGSATAGAVSQAVANYSIDTAVLRAAAANGQAAVEVYWPVCSGR